MKADPDNEMAIKCHGAEEQKINILHIPCAMDGIEAGDGFSRLWSNDGSIKVRDISEVLVKTEIASEAASRTFPRSSLRFV